jgi:hypothetical protein
LAGGVDAAWHVPAADPVGELDGHDVVAGGGDGAADVQLAERAARLNMAEVFFSIITRQAIGRGSFTSVKDLIAAIENFIDGWNDRCHPFTRTKTVGEILPKCRPGKRASFTRH